MSNDEIKRKYLDAARKAEAVKNGEVVIPIRRAVPDEASRSGGAGGVSGTPVQGRVTPKGRAKPRKGNGCLRVFKWLLFIGLVLFGLLVWWGWTIENEKADAAQAELENVHAVAPPDLAAEDHAQPTSDAEVKTEPLTSEDEVGPLQGDVAAQPDVGYMAQMADLAPVEVESSQNSPIVPSFACPDSTRPAYLFAKTELAICSNATLAALDVDLEQRL